MAAATDRYVWPLWDLCSQALDDHAWNGTARETRWVASGSGTNEYYLAGTADTTAIPGLTKPPQVVINSTKATEATAGSLGTDEWDWADNDSLGFSTIYVRLGTGNDPDSEAADYVQCGGEDTSGAATSEAGAFETIQYGLNQAGTGYTKDTTDGERWCIKAGGEEEFPAASSLTTTTYGAPTNDRQCIILEGYRTTIGDYHLAKINCGGDALWDAQTLDHTHHIALEVYNSGTDDIIALDNNCSVILCEIHDGDGRGVGLDNYAHVAFSYIHDCADSEAVIDSASYGRIYGNTIEVTSGRTPTYATLAGVSAVIEDNNYILRGATDGIRMTGDACWIRGNNFYAHGAATGTAVFNDSSRGLHLNVFDNNFEGLSGTGGVAVDLSAGTICQPRIYTNNYYRDNATNEAGPADKAFFQYQTAVALSASPFSDAANSDFTPVDTGDGNKEGAAISLTGFGPGSP